ncbi:MAG: hypothetical protein GY866_21535 [Proteobacteria bacterium]|nr:hypothetical protein [Pseudomonadota bacterium]
MSMLFASIVVFSIAMLGMSVGVIFSKNVAIKGHCGEPTLLEGCIKDSQGNKIRSCATCDCE